MLTDGLPTAEWRVVIAEDEPDSVRMVSKILEHHGIHVVAITATSASRCSNR
jgi:CheY-like chemotaxis protein